LKFGVVVFPGSNCDYDTFFVLKDVVHQQTVFLWHKDHDLQGADCVVLPGGFSYGDYLRSGAIARFSPLMQEVCEFADRGGLVLGICNGFQVLLELGLLPGAMLRNKNLKFRGSPGAPAAARSCASRSPTSTDIISPHRNPCATWKNTARSFFATSTRKENRPRRPTSTDRRPALPG
jgi:putative intracellular protease/amidase